MWKSFLLLGLFVSSSYIPAHEFTSLDDAQKISREERLEIKHTVDLWTSRERTITLQLRRIRREGAPPVIISHAVVINNKAMRHLGHFLWESGFDVWMPNMRGHGSNDELSHVDRYYKGDYGFDKMVTEDWPTVLKYIRKHTKQKVHIIGYSMGGMTWEQFLSGVYKSPEGLRQSDKLARERASQVHSFTGLVIPPDFVEVSPQVKALLNPIQGAFHRSYFIPLTGLYPAPSLFSVLFQSCQQCALGLVAPYVYNMLPDGILESARLENAGSEFREFVIQSLSAPHTDYVKDFLRWFEHGYYSYDGQVHYGMNKKVYVPTLSIAATEDSLAPIGRIIRKAKLYPEEAKVQILLAENYAHLDIAFKGGIEGFSQSLLQFLKAPHEKLKEPKSKGFSLLKPESDYAKYTLPKAPLN